MPGHAYYQNLQNLDFVRREILKFRQKFITCYEGNFFVFRMITKIFSENPLISETFLSLDCLGFK